MDVPVRVQAHVCHHARQEDVLARAESLDTDRLALEVAHGADPFGAEQDKAADVNSREHEDRIPGIYLHHKRRDEVEGDVGLPGREGLGRLDPRRCAKVLHVGEPFGAQKIIGHVLGGDADAGDLHQLDPCGLEGRLGDSGRRVGAQPRRRPCRRQTLEELPPARGWGR